MLDAVRAIYRESKKPRDNFWTEWCSRPPAAALVLLLRGTSATPNQITFLSIAVFGGAAALLCAWPAWPGLLLGALVIQISYVLDCVDGQLARVKKMSSPVGALLDFLMDEVKAFLLVGAAAVRLWVQEGDARWLLLGVGGLFVVATGISLTTFTRRDEYRAATGGAKVTLGATPESSFAPTGRGLIGWVEAAGKLVMHYPSHFWLFALLDRLDLFVYIYLGAHFLYLGRTSLAVLLKLGRPARAPAAPPPGEAAS